MSSYASFWQSEKRWRGVSALFWHSVCMTVLVHAVQARVPSLWTVFSPSAVLSAFGSLFSLRSVFCTFVFVFAQTLVLLSRLASYRVHLDTRPYAWRVFGALTNPIDLFGFGVFPVSALMSVWAYVEMTDAAVLYPGWPLPVVNDDTVFVVVGLLVYSIVAGLRFVLGNERTLRFPGAGRSAAHRVIRMKAAIVSGICDAARTAVVFLVCWGLLHWTTLRWNRPIGLQLIRPFVPSSALSGAGSLPSLPTPMWTLFPVHVSSVFALFYYVLLLDVASRVSRAIVNLFFTELLAFDQYLLRALSDVRDPYARLLATLDVMDVAEFSLPRRRDIFGTSAAAAAAAAGSSGADAAALMDGGASPAPLNRLYFQWPSRAEVVRVCRPIVVAAGTSTLAVGMRGGSASDSSTVNGGNGNGYGHAYGNGSGIGAANGFGVSAEDAAVQSAVSAGTAAVAHARSFEERATRVMESPCSLVLENCLSNVSALADRLYEDIRRVRSPAPPSSSVCGSCASVLPAGVFRPSSSQRSEWLFEGVPLTVASVQTVSMLLSAAAREDPLHALFQFQAQSQFQSQSTSIGDAVASLLGLSIAVDEYIACFARAASGSAMLSASEATSFMSPKEAARLQGQQLLRPALAQLSFHLDNAMYRLVSTFYEHIGTFVLPPEYAHRLQSYAQWQK